MAQNTPNRQLYDLLVSKNFDIQALDSRTGRGPVNDQGQPDINQADEYRFDFVPQSGRNYGSVVVLFGDDNNLTMFFGDNVGKGMEGEDKQEWFDFLYQMKQFATKNFLDFQPENITRLKYTKQGQAAIKEGLFESWQGRGNISWNGQPTEARLVIKHKKALGEGEARFRFIESIYIETADSERFKLKSRSLTAAKAMLEHVRQGGNPYDARAQHINEIVEELGVLSRFRRANANKVLEGDTKNLVEQTDAYYRNMHSVLKHLGTSRGYQGYFESWTPADVNEGNLVVEDLKQLFVEQTIDHRIEEALPLLARITQEANDMKEAQIFESWINNLVEGTWALPETPEQKQELIDLMSKDFPVGADATNATEQLYNILGDDELFDRLQELADADANADARSVVMTRLQELSSASPDVEAVLGQLQTTNPAAPEPDQMATDVDGDEQLPQSVEEADDLSSIEEAQCNMTSEGEYCPKHGLEECGIYEYTGNVTNFGLEEDGTTAYYEDNEIVKNAKKLTDGWKGTLAGSAAGGIAGDVAGKAIGPLAGAKIGAALGGLPGAAAGLAAGTVAGGPIGSAIGSLAGGKIGDKLGGQNDDIDEEGTPLGKEKPGTGQALGTVGGALAGGTPGAILGGALGKALDETDIDEESDTAKIVKGAMKAATQGLSDVSGAGKEIAKNMVYMENDPLTRLKKLALGK